MLRVEHNIIGMCGTNTYYIFDENTKKAIIVDPAGDAQRLIDRVAKLDITPVDVFITHGHFDHILAVDEIRDKYQIPVYAGEDEKTVLHDPEANLTGLYLGMSMVVDADVYLKDGEEFTVGDFKVKAIFVPGHTVGGTCYYFEEHKILISGDTLFNESVGRTDFPGGSTSALINGIKDKLFTLPEDVTVYPGHMDSTTIGYEKKYNPFCR